MAYLKLNFSRSALAALPTAPAGKRVYYGDTKESGLVLCVTGAGTKSFQVYQKIGGRPVRVTLGRFTDSLPDSVELPRDCSHTEFLSNTPELNVRMARSLAALVKIDLKAGINAADTKRAKRAELTLGEMFEEYVSRHMVPHGKKTVDECRSNFERYLGELPDELRKKHGKERVKPLGSVNWHRRRLSTITNQEIRKVVSDLGHHAGKHAANRALEIIRAVYNFAVASGLFDKASPVVGVRKFSTNSRDRFLQSDELPRFFEAVSQEPSADVRDYVLLSLMTGARKSNVLSIRWVDVNLDRGDWRMPDTKNNSSLTVPLMPEAVEILKERKKFKTSDFVFPGTGKSGHMEDPKKGWRRILDRDEVTQLAKLINDAGGSFEWPLEKDKGTQDHSRNYESLSETLARARKLAAEMKIDTTGTRLRDLRIHDMRRTLGSWQAATGASLVVIGRSLGHKDTASTMIYSRLNLDPVRDSMQTATRAMLAAGGVLPTAEIVPINQNKKSA